MPAVPQGYCTNAQCVTHMPENIFFQEAPFMKEYLEETYVYLPYVMHFHRPLVRKTCFSTDRYGFRTTHLNDGTEASLDDFNAGKYQNPCALVGNSTAFGVGALSNKETISSGLNGITSGTWFNFAGRTFNPFQELILYQMFCQVKLKGLALMTGINLYDMTYRFNQPVRSAVEPFYLEKFVSERLKKVRQKGLKELLKERFLGRKAIVERDDFLFSTVLNDINTGLDGIPDLSESAPIINAAMATWRNILQIWRCLTPNRMGKLMVFIQPVPEWFGRPLNPKEKRLLDFVDLERGEKWGRVHRFIQGISAEYRLRQEQLFAEENIEFCDLNREESLIGTEWVFIDRYHVTGTAQQVIARIIARKMGLN